MIETQAANSAHESVMGPSTGRTYEEPEELPYDRFLGSEASKYFGELFREEELLENERALKAFQGLFDDDQTREPAQDKSYAAAIASYAMEEYGEPLTKAPEYALSEIAHNQETVNETIAQASNSASEPAGWSLAVALTAMLAAGSMALWRES